MNRIKIVLFLPMLLLFASCSFWGEPPQSYIGTISMVKQKDVTGYIMGAVSRRTYSYKLEILTSEGLILRGEYEDDADKYKPGDFVQVTVSGNKIDELKILDRPIMDSHF